MSDTIFFDPAVLKVVRAILAARGVRTEQDLEDGIGDVVLAAIEHVLRTGRPAGDVAQAIAIVRPIANARGAYDARTRARRAATNLGPTADADQHAAAEHPSLDPVDQERMLAAIRQVLREDQIEALADVAAGVQQAELAAESKASDAAVRKRVQRSREKALGALRERGYWVAGGFAALLAGLIAIYVGAWRDDGRVARPPSARELAARERSDAADACRAQRWDECERALDRAARLDAEGERDEPVPALRAAIAAGRRAIGWPDGGGDL
ncbi:MAG TPA: hypothetical protein VKU41_12270 [Polyangiaceae bacterium]|nr:hypothetical protein [Polyangiaceae bacterium]